MVDMRRYQRCRPVTMHAPAAYHAATAAVDELCQAYKPGAVPCSCDADSGADMYSSVHPLPVGGQPHAYGTWYLS